MMVKNEALIQLTGWLNDVKDFQWGRALKVSVDVRKQNEAGVWETVDKTTYDITTDNFGPLEGVKQVVVVGRITGTNVFQKRDGSSGFSIKVRAESVTPAENQVVQNKVDHAAVNAVWPTVTPGSITESAPF
jgi:DNA-binding helix-hairpin-helix protein with protein kinase domain